MAHSFKTNSGYRTFGVFSEPADAGDYIYNKKARASFCVANSCTPAVKVGTQSNMLLFNRSNRLSVFPCQNFIDKANLNINLITQLDLSGVPVIADISVTPNAIPSTVNPNSMIPTYLQYNVDPCGNLFGNDTCGINNFVSYMVYNSNTSNKTL
jgi:hypothetical protein